VAFRGLGTRRLRGECKESSSGSMKNVRMERGETKNILIKLKQKHTEGRINYFKVR